MRWSSLILAVLALASSLHPSEALRVVQFPPNPQVGQTVFLHVEGAQFPTHCDWFRGNGVDRNRQILKMELNQVIRGPAYTGREDLWRLCSLKIQNVQASDSGPYTLLMFEFRGSESITAVGHLQVSYSSLAFQPEALHVSQFPPSPQVGQSVNLYLDEIEYPAQCSWYRGNDQRQERRIFTAKFSPISRSYLIDLKGAAHTGREEVGRACSLVIRKVQVSDSGPYTISMENERDAQPTTVGRDLRVSP